MHIKIDTIFTKLLLALLYVVCCDVIKFTATAVSYFLYYCRKDGEKGSGHALE
jgi:hypothetical protein